MHTPVMRSLLLVFCGMLMLGSSRAAASGGNPWRVWSADLRSVEASPSATPLFDASVSTLPEAALEAEPQTPAPPVPPVEYSDAYRKRAKIHKVASFATLPLFAAEVALGQSIFDTPSDSKRSAHIAIGSAIVGLFGVETITGVWNLLEARKDPQGRKRRWVHGLLMLASDAGFVATAALGPSRSSSNFDDRRSTHRTVALTSIGLGTAGYLMMLVGR